MIAAHLPLNGLSSVIQPKSHDRYAFDLIGLDERTGRRSRHSISRWLTLGIRVEDFYGWDRPILAPIGGQVSSMTDGVPDRMRSHLLGGFIRVFVVDPRRYRAKPNAMAGNHVVIESEGMYAVLAHLRQDSITVTVGDTVSAGDEVGRMGNSGTSSAPHLHFHLSDHPHGQRVSPFVIIAFEEYVEGEWLTRVSHPLPTNGWIRNLGSKSNDDRRVGPSGTGI